MKNIFYFLSFLLCFGTLTAQNRYWNDIRNESNIKYTGKREIVPQKYQTIQIDFEAFKQYLNTVPKGQASESVTSTFIFDLPMPDGKSQKFRLVESPLLAPDFALARPDIKTFTGYGVDDRTATLVMDYTPDGFHAMVLSVNGTFFIDPYAYGETQYYVVYDKKDYFNAEKISKRGVCGTKDDHEDHKKDKKESPKPKEKGGNGAIALRPSGSRLRTYRLAVAATGEYTQARGGTVASAQNAIITSINRVRGVYEKEVACSFTLINNTSIIYTNGGSDPYTNSSGPTMLGQNQTNLDNIIGNGNYDIGHVFSTGGGGVASLGSVCVDSRKARGVTGLPTPIGDPFDIDYVAHEIGHQFGGNHTFNTITGDSGTCSTGTIEPDSAYEPGSGSTIMAYAGICLVANDLQANTENDPAYFHTKSYDEILNVINARTCVVPTAVVNSIPTIDATRISGLVIPPTGFKIPAATPFFLGATAADADPNDVLTYCWEQFDLGAASEPPQAGTITSNLSGPIMRSFAPTTNPVRTIPKLASLVNNTNVIGEALPSGARNLTFKLTVRDNKPIGGVAGGVENAAFLIGVVNTGAPFIVTAPNTNGVQWQGCSTQTVNWNVAGTTANNINCANVKIMLSTDGGFTYPTTILATTPNDGSQDIIVPNIQTLQARIRVESVGNFFFDISNFNFTINQVVVTPFTMSLPNGNSISSCRNSDVTIAVNTAGVTGCNGPVNFSVTGLPAGVTAAFNPAASTISGSSTLTFTIANAALGTYNLQIVGTGSNVVSLPFTLDIVNNGVLFGMTINRNNNLGTGCVDNKFPLTITATNVSSCNGPVNFMITGIPAGVTGIPTPGSLSVSGTSVMPFEITSAAVPGVYNLQVVGTGLNNTVTLPFTLTVGGVSCNTPPTATNTGLYSYPQNIDFYVLGKNCIIPADAQDDSNYNFRYKVKSLASKGTLKINNTTLNVGDVFSKPDLLLSSVRYYPTNKNTELDDVFTFTVVDSQGAESPIYNFIVSLTNANTPTDANTSIVVYPNPLASGSLPQTLYLRIGNVKGSSQLKVSIYDEKGSTIRENLTAFKETQENDLFQLDVKFLAGGLYILKIETGNVSFVRKFRKLD